MAEHRFCFVCFRGEGKTTEIDELFVNGKKSPRFEYAFQMMDAFAEEGFKLIEHSVGQKGMNFMVHYFTFRKD